MSQTTSSGPFSQAVAASTTKPPQVKPAPVAPAAPPQPSPGDTGGDYTATGDATILNDAPDQMDASGQVPPDFFSTSGQSLKQLAQGLAPPPPQLGENAPPSPFSPPPTQKPFNPMAAWGSGAMMLATLGSLLTRQPLTAAMNAAAGVLNAYKANDVAAAKQAFDTWKIQTANALNYQKYELDYYSRIMQSNSISDREKIYEITAFARATKNAALLQALSTGGLPAAQDYLSKIANVSSGWAASAKDTNTLGLENQVWDDWISSHPNATPEEQLNARKSIFSRTTQKAVASLSTEEKINLGKSLYAQKYPHDPITNKPLNPNAPSFQQYMTDGEFNTDMSSMIGAVGGGENSGQIENPASSSPDASQRGPAVGTTHPLTPSTQGLPDGQVINLNGVYWQKQGNQLVVVQAPQ